MTSKGISLPTSLNGAGLRIVVIHTRWNAPIVNALKESAINTLTSQCNVEIANIKKLSVPGSYELPYACKCAAESGEYDAIIAIGVLIKGDTMHFEYIAEATSMGLMRVQLDTGVPVIFGVLTCLKEEQAFERAGLIPGSHSHAKDWAFAAVEMCLLKNRVKQGDLSE